MTIIIKFKNLLLNLLTLFVNIFIWRDSKVWLFGAWMGKRFADNPRFLYQYLNEHKEQYGIYRLIWVTDNREIIDEMREFGYEVYLKTSLKGLYWHFRSGVHIVSNYYAATFGQPGDILGVFSTGAKKIQLWHGVGLKATGLLRVGYFSDSSSVTNIIRKNILYNRYLLGNRMFSPGCWSNRKQLATSEENKRVAVYDVGLPSEQVFIGGYPRLFSPSILFKKEELELKRIRDISSGKTVILYCPTFREKKQSDSSYINPIENKSFRDFLWQHGFLWLEKRHAASTYNFSVKEDDFVHFLSSDFDINLLFDYVDILLTDFSSASSDFIYKRKKVLSFVPDYDEYCNEERGLLCKYEKYYPGIVTKSMEELKIGLLKTKSSNYFDKDRREKYEECRTFLYGDHPDNMEWVVDQIIKIL